jgi:hypothetical protein
MQYYFHLRHDGGIASDTDPEGAEFADLQAVREEATASIREILANGLQSGADARDGEMIVRDETGETVLTIPFSMRVRLGA